MKGLLLSFCMLFCLSLVAQDKVFLNDKGDWVNQPEATQYAVVEKEQKDHFKVEYYNLDDVLKQRTYYSEFSSNKAVKSGISTYFYPNGADSTMCVYIDGLRFGQSVDYYPNGQKKMQANYRDGVFDGYLLQYYSDGKMRRKEFYEKNVCKGGMLYDENGDEMEFFPYYISPEIEGGIDTIIKFLSRNLKYPRAIEEGIVYTSFIVEEDGNTHSVQIERGVSPAMDKEALRCVKKLIDSSKWIPAQIEGKNAQTRTIFKIYFKLRPNISVNIQ